MKPWELWVAYGDDKTVRLDAPNKAAAFNRIHLIRDLGITLEESDRFVWIPPNQIRGVTARETK